MELNNIISRLESNANSIPQTPAIIDPRNNSPKSITYSQLSQETKKLAFGFKQASINKGQRVLLMVRPGISLITITYSLLRLGAIPVLIDPGLGKKNILNCIKEAKPDSMIGIPIAHLARLLFPKYFSSIKISVILGRIKLGCNFTLNEIQELGKTFVTLEETNPQEPAAILFTSGSTGPPKGVVYSHKNFFEQSNALESIYNFNQGDVDLPTFPLFALFGSAFGMTSIIPDMDPTRPANVNPLKILNTLEKFKIINSFGSPALWEMVTLHCIKSKKRIRNLKRILIAGAPVSGKLLQQFDSLVEEDCKIYTPYGATEALPVASIERNEVLNQTWEKTKKGLGVCVGVPVPGMKVKIAKITDDPIPIWNDDLETPQGVIGEIIVQSSWVTKEYFNRPEANEIAKIKDRDLFWHRMGDLGYLDLEGRIWFCGRKSHRVICNFGTLFTMPCEAIFNQVDGVKRTALVGIGPKENQLPAIMVELESPQRKKNKNIIKKLLLQKGSEFDLTRNIKNILFSRHFPVDIRHNAKIFRDKLSILAEKKLANKKFK